MPIFAFPTALLGFATVAGLVGIYFFRNRSRNHTVSALFIWTDHRRASKGGRTREKLQTPLLFLLEILALILLVLAAAGPFVFTSGRKPITVILDDSWSMSAGTTVTDAIDSAATLCDESPTTMRFILAGRRPQVLKSPAYNGEDVRDILKDWKPQAASSDLEAGISLANELTSANGRILVISDAKPSETPTSGRVRWTSVGKRLVNCGFVTATRAKTDIDDKVLLEIANFDNRPTSRRMQVLSGDVVIKDQLLRFESEETLRLTFSIPDGIGDIRVELEDDPLMIDNRVHLLPEPLKNIKVSLSLDDKDLQKKFRRALDASGIAILTNTAPQLRIHSKSSDTPTDNCWELEVISDTKGKKCQSFAGPFIVDYSHPVSEGLNPVGIIWGASKEQTLQGQPVIATDNIVLFSDDHLLNGNRILRMQVAPKISTLLRSPSFPILIHNILRWRTSFIPGISASNLRIGWQATIRSSDDVKEAEITSPDGKKRMAAFAGREIKIPTAIPGVYQVKLSKHKRYSFASNALSRTESNLSHLETGHWGKWDELTQFGNEYSPITWLPALLAIAALVAHTVLIQRANGGRRS